MCVLPHHQAETPLSETLGGTPHRPVEQRQTVLLVHCAQHTLQLLLLIAEGFKLLQELLVVETGMLNHLRQTTSHHVVAHSLHQKTIVVWFLSYDEGGGCGRVLCAHVLH